MYSMAETNMNNTSVSFTQEEIIGLITDFCMIPGVGLFDDELDQRPEYGKLVKAGYLKKSENYQNLNILNDDGIKFIHENISRLTREFAIHIGICQKKKVLDMQKWIVGNYQLKDSNLAKDILTYIADNSKHYKYTLSLPANARDSDYIQADYNNKAME